MLWDAASDAEAAAQLEALAGRSLGAWEAALRGDGRRDEPAAEGWG